MIVLILCAGEQTRWPESQLKQLANIGGEPLLNRTVRQVMDYGYVPVVVSHKSALIMATDAANYVPMRHRNIVETLLSTRELWHERVVVLLGDVVYSRDAMHTIIMDDKPLTFYASWGEIYALAFNADDYDTIITAAKGVMLYGNVIDCRLWNLFNNISGIPMEAHIGLIGKHFVEIADYTDDLDSLADYQNFVKHVINAGKLDDLAIAEQTGI